MYMNGAFSAQKYNIDLVIFAKSILWSQSGLYGQIRIDLVFSRKFWSVIYDVTDVMRYLLSNFFLLEKFSNNVSVPPLKCFALFLKLEWV